MTERIVRSPYDGREAGRVTVPAPADVEAAVAKAAKVFETTRKLPTYRRASILRAIADAILGKKEGLARTIALEAGKPLKAARTEVDRAAGTFSAAAAAVETASGTHFPLDMNPASPGRWGILRRVPIGPVAAITPFNFPLNLTAHKVAPAIGVGAPVVQKPASQTPLSAVALREIVHSAGWPEEAYAVLCVPGAAGEALVTDPRLPVVSFTGSAAVGWRLKEIAPRKRVGLELGGNAGLIVHEDADLADAAARAASGGFVYAGQSCISVQRILVHRPVEAAFRDLLLSATAKMKTGDPLDESVDVGPMISEADAVRAQTWVREAVEAGAELLAGGKRSGSVLSPTVLARTVPSMKVECDEVFAPVVTLTSYETFEEALARVNDSRYGLQAGVFTRDLGRIEQAFETLEVGGIIVNDAPTWRADRMPYGGVKESGVGREGPLYTMEEFTEPRLLVLRAP